MHSCVPGQWLNLLCTVLRLGLENKSGKAGISPRDEKRLTGSPLEPGAPLIPECPCKEFDFNPLHFTDLQI